MTVVLSRPYQFIPPARSPWWPAGIQNLRLIDWHLRSHDSVIDYELRHEDRFAESIRAGHGIILAPNHCRYADPIAIGWLARGVGTHLYAMASWHLFNKSAFDTFALRRMGAFSVNREGSDRQSLELAIEFIVTGERPLVLFPEGTTNRTNDVLKPLLDGITFIARTAARRRAKENRGRVVMHPVGFKYLCVGDPWVWLHQQLCELERALTFQPVLEAGPPASLLPRLFRVAQAFLSLKEIEFTGKASEGDLRLRRDALMNRLAAECEAKYGLTAGPEDSIRERVRKIRTAVTTTFFALPENDRDPRPYQADGAKADLAQFLLSFPDEYLVPGQITDTRLVETVQRIQEAVYGKAQDTMPLRVVIEVDEAIEVPAERPPRSDKNARDPLLCQLDDRLRTMIARLATEARPLPLDPSLPSLK